MVTGGQLVTVAKEFTRPADTTAYAANDVVSDSTSATTIQSLVNVARINGGSGYIVGAALRTNLKSVTPRIRVHLFNAVGATVSADNAPAQSKYADIGKRLGSFDLAALATSVDTTNSDYSGVVDSTLRIPFVCAGGDRNLYFVTETLDAFTPASGEKFSLTIFADVN
jgi:hypothetical protein